MSAIGMVVLTVIVLAALFGLCHLAVKLQKDFPSEKYDERQKIARGDGYRLAFWTGIVYYVAIMIAIGFEDLDSFSSVTLITMGILVEAMVLHFHGFLTHSALPLGEKPMISIVCWSIMGVMYLVEYFFLYPSWYQIVYGLCFLTMALLHILSLLRKEEE